MPTWEDYQHHLGPKELAILQQDAIIHLSAFVKDGWHVLEPSTRLLWAPYLDVMCAELEAWCRGDVKRLLINIPPGCMKSLMCSVFVPAWRWLHDPSRRVLAWSKGEVVAKRDARRMRMLIRSEWYQALVKRQADLDVVPLWTIEGGKGSQDARVNYENTATGSRQCFPFGADITGSRGTDGIIDDPHDAKDVALGSPEQVRKRLDEAWDIYAKVLTTRVTEQWLIIMQRLAHGDLAGRLIELEADEWRVVCLPMAYEPDHPQAFELDPRTEEGELLHPALYGQDEVSSLARKLGSQAAGQLQQRPSTAQGGLYKRAWFVRRFVQSSMKQAASCDQLAVSVDAAFKGLSTSDPVAIGVWGMSWPDVYLLDVVCARMDYPGTKRALRDVLARWPRVSEILIEEKANGAALIAELRGEFPGVIGYNPRASKYARAQIVAPFFESGNVWLPERAEWVQALVEEFVSFPHARHDDQVDMTSQMLIRWLVDGRAATEGFLGLA